MLEPTKVALITGASSGIGRALALGLAARGWDLALTARQEDALEAVAAEARGHGVRARLYPCDTTDRAAVTAAAEAALRDFGRIDWLILSAGIAGRARPGDVDADGAAETLNVNVLGALYWIGALLPAMRARGAGAIVGLSSLAAARGLPGSGPYSASKAALSTLLESLRVDLKPAGVRVVTVEPGFVRTPMTDKNRFKMPFLMEAEPAAELILERLARGRSVIRFPWPMALLTRVIRALPVWCYDLVIGSQARRHGR